MAGIRRLLTMLVVVLLGGGFSCRAQILENDMFYFENPQSVYTMVGGLLSSSQMKYSMVVGKKDNSLPIVEYAKRHAPFGRDKLWVEEGAKPILDYYFGHRSKVYIVAWRGKDKKPEVVDSLYQAHRRALRAKTNLEVNGRAVMTPGMIETQEKVTFMGDTEALHRTIMMMLSQTLIAVLFPPIDFYYDLYQYYDKNADATVVALFYRVEINPDMRENFPEEKSDAMRADFERHFKLKKNAPANTARIKLMMIPVLILVDSPHIPTESKMPETSTGEKSEPKKPKTETPSDVPKLPETPREPPVLKRSAQKTVYVPDGGDVLQFAEDASTVYILYKRGSLWGIDKKNGTKRIIVDDFAVTGVVVDGKGRLLLYTTHRGVIHWNGKSVDTSPSLFKYDGGTGFGYKSKLGLIPGGNLLVYGGTSVPAVRLSPEGKLLDASEALQGEKLFMLPDGTVWARTLSTILSGKFSGTPVEHTYGDKWGNELQGTGDMCLRDDDVLVCGNKLFVCRSGKWQILSISKIGYQQHIAVDNQGNIWVASDDGVACMGKDGKSPLKVLTSLDTPAGKKTLSYIKGLYADANGNIWIVMGREVIVYNPDGVMGLLTQI